eukprot:TRINITY_DN437_c0_g2_i1.p1 TRINITY_DN437_c0_g2~~TRINITY_DN437_c0_g2_i1.p1  ORF type:complete len:221 (+),score=91.59 TRINITY_DN437_c0_g2_i1:102-764(+)
MQFLTKLSILLLFIILNIINSNLVLIHTSNNPIYQFPNKWQANVQGWVADGLTNHEPAISTGFFFSDYTIQSQRVDEVWNLTSIHGTDIYNLGILSDTHLFYPESAYFYYTNSSGQFCSLSATGYLSQNMFASEDSFIGETTYNNVKVYQFSSSYSTGILKNVNITLYVSTISQKPIAFVVPNIGRFFDGSVVNFITFDEVKGNFPFQNDLFNPPSYCKS